jgi:hypothetical protein
MRNALLLTLVLWLVIPFYANAFAMEGVSGKTEVVSVGADLQSNHHEEQADDHTDDKQHATDDSHGASDEHGAEGEDHSAAPPGWTVIPFVLLLSMIATGPLFYEHFWHKNYPIIAVSLATIVVLYYLFGLHNAHAPVHALAEYIQFIALLASLYIASGGIMIDVDKKATPMANVLLLIVGAVISNLIGTTGASYPSLYQVE